MMPDIWVPVKVLPGKEALETFTQKWKESGGRPFSGEWQTPDTTDLRRLMTTDVDAISHCITDIDMKTYNDATRTVMMKCRFTGPYGAEAMEKYINKDIRFCARVAVGPDAKTGETVQRIVTFDCVQRPPGTRKDLVDRIKEDKEIKREADFRAAYDKRRK